jgi:hypothetical protein
VARVDSYCEVRPAERRSSDIAIIPVLDGQTADQVWDQARIRAFLGFILKW